MQRAYMNRRGDPKAVIAEYEKALEAHPNDANYLFYYGSALLGNKTPQAKRYMEEALAKGSSTGECACQAGPDLLVSKL